MKSTVSFSDFEKLDLRVGKVVTAEQVVRSTSLIRLMIDLGKDIGERKILAGIAKWYKAEELIGKKFIFVVNLAPKKMMGEESQGMMLAGDVDGECKLITVDDSFIEGSIVR